MKVSASSTLAFVVLLRYSIQYLLRFLFSKLAAAQWAESSAYLSALANVCVYVLELRAVLPLWYNFLIEVLFSVNLGNITVIFMFICEWCTTSQDIFIMYFNRLQ